MTTFIVPAVYGYNRETKTFMEATPAEKEASRFRIGNKKAYASHNCKEVWVNMEAAILESDSPAKTARLAAEAKLPVVQNGDVIELAGYGKFKVTDTGHSDARLEKVED